MKLSQLRSAVAILNSDFNLTRAAEALNATQPGVSTHIRLLEAELGLKLFARRNRRFVGLTPAGQTILPLAAQAMRSINDLETAARRLHSPQSRSVVIAASPTRLHAMADAIATMRQRYPKLRIGVLGGNVTQVLAALANGDADIGVVSATAARPSEVDLLPCYEVNWYLVAPAGHAVTRREPIGFADLTALPLISYDESFRSRAILTEAFQSAGQEPNIVLGLGDCEAMQQFVIAGAGFAIVRTPPHDIIKHPDIVARRLDHLLPSSTICIGTRKGTQADAPTRFLIRLLRLPPGNAGKIDVRGARAARPKGSHSRDEADRRARLPAGDCVTQPDALACSSASPASPKRATDRSIG